LRAKHFFFPPSRFALGPNQFPVSCVYCVFHLGKITELLLELFIFLYS